MVLVVSCRAEPQLWRSESEHSSRHERRNQLNTQFKSPLCASGRACGYSCTSGINTAERMSGCENLFLWSEPKSTRTHTTAVGFLISSPTRPWFATSTTRQTVLNGKAFFFIFGGNASFHETRNPGIRGQKSPQKTGHSENVTTASPNKDTNDEGLNQQTAELGLAWC